MNANISPAVLTPERLHARYEPKIRRHVRAVLGSDNDCDDLVQDVLVTVLRKSDSLRDPTCLDAWVNQVTTNTLKYMLRQRRMRRHASWETLTESEVPALNTNHSARELAARVLRVMHRLPANDRALLATYWFSPATAVSIAEQDGCSVITVRRRLCKARTRFERLARNDPALASCFEEARSGSRRRRASVAAAAASARVHYANSVGARS